MIPATSPIIPSATITTTGAAPAFVDVGVGVPGAVTAVVETTGAREIICCRYRAGAATRKTDRCIPAIIAGSVQLN